MFNCEECVMSFSRRDNLKRHLKMHDSSGFKCSSCDKLFTRKDNLSRHTKLFHSEKEAHPGLVNKNKNLNGSRNDIPTNTMWEWDDTINYVVCNKAYDAARVEVRLSVQDNHIKISPLVFVPNIPAEVSKYGCMKRNIDRLEKNTKSYITDNDLSEVQKNEVLGNTIDEDYKDKIKKNWAWIEEISSLINSLKDKNEAQQNIILQDIMARWHTIRDNYVGNLEKQVKSLRSDSVAKKPKLYFFGKQLSLPEKTGELRNTDSNFEDFPTTLFEAKSHNINETETKQDSTSNTDGGIKFLKVVKNSSFSECSTNKHKKSSVEEALIDFIKNYKIKKTSKKKDEDLEFFYYILPTVKSLTSDQKFSFRIQTMQHLFNLSSQNISSVDHSIKNSSNTPLPLNTTPVNSFESPTDTPEIDFVWKSSATSAASYYAEFSPD